MPGLIQVAIPTASFSRNEISVALASRLLELKKSKEYDVSIGFSQKQPIDANRNRIVKRFLEKENSEWLLMIDSDIVPPKNILDITKHDKKVVSAVVMGMQKDVPHPLIMKKTKKGLYAMVGLGEFTDNVDSQGLLEVDGVGCGCLLIHRSVLENMDSPWFKTEYTANGDVKYSEDYSFSRKLNKMGQKIFVDTNLLCEHYKTLGLLKMNNVLYKAISQKPSANVVGETD
ncbi:MAG: hypothetical protein ACOC1X_00750 [Promethearchaeota archaeon]